MTTLLRKQLNDHITLRGLSPNTQEAYTSAVAGLAGESSLQTPGLLISRYPLSSGYLNKEPFGSPEFPSYPFESRPWSQTPVVTSTLALTHSGLLPSASSKASAFSHTCRIIQ